MTLPILPWLLLLMAGTDVIWERTTKVYRDCVLLLPRSEFEAKKLRRRLLKEYEKNSAPVAASLTIVSDRSDAGMMFKPTESSYKGFLHLRDTYGFTLHPMANLTKIGADVVIRWRDKSGSLGRSVVSGADPLRVSLGSERCDIVHLTARMVPSDVHDEGCDVADLKVFAVTSKPATTEKARLLIEHLISKLSYRCMSVHVRTDPWFFSSSDYPYIPPFLAALNVPTLKDLSASSEAFCGLRGQDLWCH